MLAIYRKEFSFYIMFVTPWFTWRLNQLNRCTRGAINDRVHTIVCITQNIIKHHCSIIKICVLIIYAKVHTKKQTISGAIFMSTGWPPFRYYFGTSFQRGTIFCQNRLKMVPITVISAVPVALGPKRPQYLFHLDEWSSHSASNLMIFW